MEKSSPTMTLWPIAENDYIIIYDDPWKLSLEIDLGLKMSRISSIA